MAMNGFVSQCHICAPAFAFVVCLRHADRYSWPWLDYARLLLEKQQELETGSENRIHKWALGAGLWALPSICVVWPAQMHNMITCKSPECDADYEWQCVQGSCGDVEQQVLELFISNLNFKRSRRWLMNINFDFKAAKQCKLNKNYN